MPARQYVFVLSDANSRTGKSGERGGEAGSKVLDIHGRDVLSKNGELVLGFTEVNKLALLNSFFCTFTSIFGQYADKAGVPRTDPLR